jgi:phosphatidylglycerol:prolipoprotein diacylglycerol transferase
VIHNFDPVIFHIGAFPIRWYPIAYITGLLAGFWYIKFTARYTKLKLARNMMDDLFYISIICIIIGGRLTYVLVYDLKHFLEHPIEIFKTWQGGMSFHGGMLGLIVACIITAKKHNVSMWHILDLCACIAPLGIFLGRLANFINGELFGRPTSMPWGVVFRHTSEMRHPSQIYEALTEGLLLLIIMNLLFFFTATRKKPGVLSGIFCILYSTFRFLIEYFREPDQQLGYLIMHLTMGQLLSVATLILGLVIIALKGYTARQYCSK